MFVDVPKKMEELFAEAKIKPNKSFLMDATVETFLELWEKISPELAVKISNYIAKKDDEAWLLAYLSNLIPDSPVILWTGERRGFGLFADKPYKSRQVVTDYGGAKRGIEHYGDYVIQYDEKNTIDGAFGFNLKDKGRWINEDRGAKNVEIRKANPWPYVFVDYGKQVEKGEEFLWDYGPNYERTYPRTKKV